MNLLITGGCGFIGHHVVEHFLKNTDYNIYIVDKLTYASSGFDRLRDINVFDSSRIKIFTADISEPWSVGLIRELSDVNYVIHLAAETHVDNSITDPRPFVRSNVLGTLELLQAALQWRDIIKLFYFSTDEVFGPAPEGVYYKEWDRYKCGNPYSASKAGGEELCMAYYNTYGLPIIVTHTMNCFGERQHSEKFIPKVIRALLKGEEITIHADQYLEKSGSRFYIHCRNVADAIHKLIISGVTGDKYNIVGEREVTNYDLVSLIADIMGVEEYNARMVDFHSSRPGHDLRYALDGSKMLKDFGWRPPVGFERSLEKTVRWTLDNPKWLKLEEYNDYEISESNSQTS